MIQKNFIRLPIEENRIALREVKGHPKRKRKNYLKKNYHGFKNVMLKMKAEII